MTTIDINALTPSQLTALKRQIAAARKAKTGDHAARNAIIDRMLIALDGEFVHTTSDILVALQSADVVARVLTAEERAAQLKMIQTRKQKLSKKNPTIAYGYKASATGLGALTLPRVQSWIATASADDRKTILATLRSK